MSRERPLELHVEVTEPPEPSLLRVAIEARLKRRPWHGPETPVADAVAAAVERAREPREPGPWRS
jgi:hypothetical protein